MSLYLNNQKILGSAIKVSVTLPLAAEDMSGQSSYAESVETGDKPKQISVKLLIKFENAKDLTALVNLAQAKDDVGERVIYAVLNDSARAMNIRRVRFQGDLMAREDETTKLWSVSFKLSEVRSVPETKEARLKAQPVVDQPAVNAKTVAPVAADSAAPTVAQLSTFDGVLKFVELATAIK